MRLHVFACCLLAVGGLMSLATTAIAQQVTDNLKAAEFSGAAAAEQTLDKSALPRASKDFKSQTKILDGYISSSGIIERIEGDTIYLLSGDRFKVLQGIPVIPHYRGENRTRTVLGTDVLARGMAISYTLRDGRLEQVFIAGIVDEPFGNATVYDKIKTLGLQKGSVNTTGIDPRYSIRIKGKDGEVEIKAGETRLIQLAEPVMVIEWRAAEFKPEGVEDIESFDYLLVEYRENGRIAFTCYATPTDPKKADQSDQGGKGEKGDGVSYVMSKLDANGNAQSGPKTLIAKDGRRRDEGPGAVFIYDRFGNPKLVLTAGDFAPKQAQVFKSAPQSKPVQFEESWLNLLESTKDATKVAEESGDDGARIDHYRVEPEDPKVVFDVWIDPNAKSILRVEFTETRWGDPMLDGRYVITEIKTGQNFDESLFSFDPPEGYQVIVIEDPNCAPGQVNGRDTLEALQAELAQAREDWISKVQKAVSDEERSALLDADPNRLFEPRFLQLARDHAAESTALDAAEWLCENARPGPVLDEGLAIVQRHHLADTRVGELCRRLGYKFSPKVEQFLSTVTEKHADRYTRGVALLCLGHFEFNLHDYSVSARSNPEWIALARTNSDQATLDWILAVDPVKCAARVDAICKQIEKEYGDLINKTASEQTGRMVTLADSAKALQFSLHAVGSVAPEIAGKSGTGADVRLSGFQGKVVLLMFSANWCGPCKAMYGQLRELMRLYADKPFTVMTVMADQEASSVSAAVTSGTITWPAIWDGENGPIATSWNVTGYPTIYLIDRDNRIVKKDLRDDALDDEVATLLGIDPAARIRLDKRTRVWSLSLRDKKLSGEELPELLDGYTELRELDLSDNPIADEALLHLVPLKNLQTLRLEHTGISDAGLRHLKELRSLKQLHLDAAPGHKTSEPGRRELRKSLPGLQTYLITN